MCHVCIKEAHKTIIISSVDTLTSKEYQWKCLKPYAGYYETFISSRSFRLNQTTSQSFIINLICVVCYFALALSILLQSLKPFSLHILNLVYSENLHFLPLNIFLSFEMKSEIVTKHHLTFRWLESLHKSICKLDSSGTSLKWNFHFHKKIWSQFYFL